MTILEIHLKGAPASGKSTHARALAVRLKSFGYTVSLKDEGIESQFKPERDTDLIAIITTEQTHAKSK